MIEESLAHLEREILKWLRVFKTRNEHGPVGIGAGPRRRVQC